MADENKYDVASKVDPSFTSLGNEQLDSYYQSFIKTLPNQEIEYTPIEYETQTVGGIKDQVSSYMRSYYDKAIKQRRAQTGQYTAAADLDAASRGMTSSTYLSDLKGRQYAAEASDIANLESDYAANLSQTVQQQYNQYLQNKLQVDTQNVANKMNVDQWNAQARLALEELAYSRAQDAKRNAGTTPSVVYVGGGGGGSKTPKPEDTEPLYKVNGKYYTASQTGAIAQNAKHEATNYGKARVDR